MPPIKHGEPAWKELTRRLSPQEQKIVTTHWRQYKSALLDLDAEFLERLARAQRPSALLDELEHYCLARFNVCAEALLPLAITDDLLGLNRVYEAYLSRSADRQLKQVTELLQHAEVRQDLCEEFQSKLSALHAAQMSQWCREAIQMNMERSDAARAADPRGVVETAESGTIAAPHGVAIAATPGEYLDAVVERPGERETSIPTAKRWNDVEIWFLSEHSIQAVVCGQHLGSQNYAEMGFENRRTGKPRAAWDALRFLAEHNGTIQRPAHVGKAWLKIEKRIQELRDPLRTAFRVTDDPILFVDGAYTTQFRITLHQAYQQ